MCSFNARWRRVLSLLFTIILGGIHMQAEGCGGTHRILLWGTTTLFLQMHTFDCRPYAFWLAAGKAGEDSSWMWFRRMWHLSWMGPQSSPKASKDRLCEDQTYGDGGTVTAMRRSYRTVSLVFLFFYKKPIYIPGMKARC